MVESCLVSIATFNFVPTPSVAATSIGSLKPAAFKSNSPPNPPIDDMAPGLMVFLGWALSA